MTDIEVVEVHTEYSTVDLSNDYEVSTLGGEHYQADDLTPLFSELHVVAGPPGPPGPAGPAGKPAYEHLQTSAAAQWNVHHGLGVAREPVLLLDTDPERPVWTDVIHVDLNNAIIILPEPATGRAYF